MKEHNKLRVLLLLNFMIFTVTGYPRVEPLVETNVGLIKGVKADDGAYSMFLGIPFGAIDADQPFGSSTPYPAFNETFEAFDDSIQCPQLDRMTEEPVGVVDCLRLNVFVPDSASSQNQLPVIVWIHGGAFTEGSGNTHEFGPKYLIRHDVILVTLNYRLGPYGFLCLDVPEVSSNAGLKDQRLALRWVKHNIEKFGGNPNSITIMGQSAGSMSIDYHLHYSGDEDLFHKAIMQSGTSQTYAGTFQENGGNFPITYAKELGFDTNDPREAIIHLSAQDHNLVMAAFAKHKTPRPELIPCDETDFENPDKFVNEKFTEVVPKIQNVPLLVGFNNEESLLNYALMPAENFKNINIVREHLLSIWNFDEKEFEEQSKKITPFYWGDEDLSIYIKQQIINFDSDLLFAYPVERDIQKFFNHNAKVIYQYYFTLSGGRNMVKDSLNVTEGGAAHADELGYLFDNKNLDEPSPADQLVMDRMTTMWTNFAKYGDPTPETTELLPIKWEPITHDKWNYLGIDSELSLGQRPAHDRYAFLDLFWELNEKKHKTYNGNKL